MSLENCPNCGRVFVKTTGTNLCPQCLVQEEKDYDKVRKYMERNPRATITEISTGTEVEEERVLDFLREGRLELAAGIDLGLHCERCGEPIAMGYLCHSCAEHLSREIDERRSEMMRDVQAQKASGIGYRSEHKKPNGPR